MATITKFEEKKSSQKRKVRLQQKGGCNGNAAGAVALRAQSDARSSLPLMNCQPPKVTPHVPMPPLQQQQNFLQPLFRPASGNNYWRPNAVRFDDDKLKEEQPPSVTRPASPLDDYKLAEKASFVPLADGAQCWKVTVRADNVVCFNGKNSFLSQLYPVSLVVEGSEYGSLEHYYQACKLFSLVDPQAARQLSSIKDPLKVKKRSHELLFSVGVSKTAVDEWKNSHGVTVTERGMRLKFGDQHPKMRDQLLATGDALLVQALDHQRGDALFDAEMDEGAVREWAKQNEGKVLKFPSELNNDSIKHIPLIGGTASGGGKNVLGVLAMHIRNELRNKNAALTGGKLQRGLGNTLACLAIFDDGDSE